jgi:hypothetical protein
VWLKVNAGVEKRLRDAVQIATRRQSSDFVREEFGMIWSYAFNYLSELANDGVDVNRKYFRFLNNMNLPN